MNAANPFQIPSCLQISLQQRRRERFKKSVIVVVAGTTVLLAVLLILGCNSEHARAASVPTVAATASTTLPDASVAAPAAVSQPVSPVKPSTPSPIVALTPAPIVPKTGASGLSTASAGIYVVKPADTLSRIAKTHGTTVSALKAANALDTDRIAVGMKLKLPEA